MAVLDARLRYRLSEQAETEPRRLPGVPAAPEGVQEAGSGEMAEVHLRCALDVHVAALCALGLRVWSVTTGAERVISGEIPVSVLPRLAAAPSVFRVESARTLYYELDISRVDIGVQRLQEESPSVRGPASSSA